MRISLVEDVGAPVAVAAADILTSEYKPDWNKGVGIGLACVGMIGAALGFGGQFLKNVGIASMPWGIESIYDLVRGRAGGVTKLQHVANPVSHLSRLKQPALGTRLTREYQPEFENAGARAF